MFLINRYIISPKDSCETYTFVAQKLGETFNNHKKAKFNTMVMVKKGSKVRTILIQILHLLKRIDVNVINALFIVSRFRKT